MLDEVVLAAQSGAGGVERETLQFASEDLLFHCAHTHTHTHTHTHITDTPCSRKNTLVTAQRTFISTYKVPGGCFNRDLL